MTNAVLSTTIPMTGPVPMLAGMGATAGAPPPANVMQLMATLAPLIVEIRKFIDRNNAYMDESAKALKIALQNQVRLMQKLQVIEARLPEEKR